MESELSKAQHYRGLAANMRRLADQEADGESKKALIFLAEKYEALCQNLVDRTERAKS